MSALMIPAVGLAMIMVGTLLFIFAVVAYVWMREKYE
jgi:hypothetical protein